MAFFRDRQDRQDRGHHDAPPPVMVAPQPEEPLPVPPSTGTFLGTGRRKSAVARVRLIPGKGRIVVNQRECDDFFTQPQERNAVRDPLSVTKTLGHFDVFVLVHGGGHSGQSHAVRMGVARALVAADKRYDSTLRRNGFLTRDARIVERKKYGRRKARRRFQFSKR